MKITNTIQIIINLINEYDNHGGILTEELALKYERIINENRKGDESNGIRIN